MIEIIEHGTKQTKKCKACGCKFSFEKVALFLKKFSISKSNIEKIAICYFEMLNRFFTLYIYSEKFIPLDAYRSLGFTIEEQIRCLKIAEKTIKAACANF